MKSCYTKNGKFHEVQNLGWCLRHARTHIIEYMGFNYAPDSTKSIDGQFFVKFEDCTYFSDYASLSVCVQWIKRPLFYGVEFRVARIELDTCPKKSLIVNSDEHKHICKLPYKAQLDAVLPLVDGNGNA